MHTVELLDEALVLAAQLGFAIRQEWLGGSGGGGCEIKGRKCLFLDLALSPLEQLDQVAQAIRDCQQPDDLAESHIISLDLRRALRPHNAA